jgi:putative membrane protein
MPHSATPPENRPSLRDDAAHALRGLMMGAADVVPGVSGGTVALVLGIYERLVTSISRFDLTWLGLLRRGQWRAALRHVDARFLLCIVAGIALGLAALANLLQYLLRDYRPQTLAVFLGLIAASTILVARMVGRWHLEHVLLGAAGAALAYWLTGLLPARLEPSMPYLFACGAVAICAMILPGISGSYVLLILGAYEHVIAAVGDVTRGAWTLRHLATLAVFGTGCAVGLLSFSKILRWLLGRFRTGTLALLCGFMAGALRGVWPFQEPLDAAATQVRHNYWPPAGELLVPALLAVAAAVLVLVLDYVARRHIAARRRALP